MPSRDNNLFINGQWQPASGSFFSSFNPATGEMIWQGKESTSSDVAEAVEHAKQAFPKWAGLPLKERVKFLSDFSQVLRESQNHLAKMISLETGKPLWDSLNEVEAMINKVKISLEAYEQRCSEMRREQPHAYSMTRHRPHGVVAVLGPYNFPGHLPNGHIIPALLAGNTVVFKPSELTPLVAEETLRLWQKVELPPGVLNLLQGGRETGQALIHHPKIQGLFFTGSYPTGLMLSQLFASQPSKILALEMGGNNPLVIGTIEDAQAAAYATIQSAYLSSGQRCTCARRLIITPSALADQFIEFLIEMIKSISIGPYTNHPEPFMGPVISEGHVNHLLKSQAHLKTLGGIPLIEMKPLHAGTGFISPGLMDVTTIQDRPDEEIFGPFLQMIRVQDFQEAIEEANCTRFGLSAGLLSQSPEEYAFFYQHIEAGIINWNAPLTGATSWAPFGGIKCSGNYRPSAYYAADYCAYPVASLETPRLKIPEFFSPGIHLKPKTIEQ